MKSALFISILSSALLAGIIENNEGTFLQIFAQKMPRSNVVATVSTTKGKITTKRCFSTPRDGEWCKISYRHDGMTLNGFSDKKSLDTISATPNRSKTFEKSYGGRYDDVANDILVLDDGYLVVGYTESFGEGGKDTYIIKLDKFGNKIYTASYGGRNSDVANAVVAVKGGFMITGVTNSFGNRIESLYLAKISKGGNLVWQNGYYSDKDDYYKGNDLVAISDTNVLIAGSEDHIKFFDSEVNIYLNAIDSRGKRNGIKRYGGEDLERAYSIIKTDDGYVMAGETETWGHGRSDAYIVKIDKEGNRIWHNAFGFDYDEKVNELIATSDGGYLLVGVSDSDHRNQDGVYVVKVDKDGQKVWQSLYGSREDDEGFGAVEVKDGFVIAGYTKGTKNYDSDVYLFKIDKEGGLLWSRRYGGAKDDKAYAIAKLSDGFVITGYSTSSNSYSKDVYLLRVDTNGNVN